MRKPDCAVGYQDDLFHILLDDRKDALTDRAIRLAQETLWATLRIVVEPGGAAAFAALLSGGYRPRPDERIGILLSGGNTTAVNFDH